MKKILKAGLLTVIFVLLLSSLLFAQGAPPATPIDGGLSLLLIGGGIYSLKKIRDSRQAN